MTSKQIADMLREMAQLVEFDARDFAVGSGMTILSRQGEDIVSVRIETNYVKDEE